jgi:hypothetical protein
MALAPKQAIPTREALRDASQSRVKWWLRDALIAYLADGSARHFAPFSDFIGRGDMLSAEIHSIYCTMPAPARIAWRRAIADIVAELPATPENAEAIAVLIDVARFIPAHEIFERAGGRLRNPRLAQLRVASGESLFDRCLKLAMAMAADTEMMREVLLALIKSGNLRRVYALQALAALARADPGNWTEHLATLRPHIKEMLLVDRPSAEGLKRHARALLSALGPQRFLDDSVKLRKAPYNASKAERALCDDWLFDAVFGGRDPLIRRQGSDSGRIIFIEADKPTTLLHLSRSKLSRPLDGPCEGPRLFAAPWRPSEPQQSSEPEPGGDVRRSVEEGFKRKGFNLEEHPSLAMAEND